MLRGRGGTPHGTGREPWRGIRGGLDRGIDQHDGLHAVMLHVALGGQIGVLFREGRASGRDALMDSATL
jgi:hypothetical protein